MGEDCTCHLQRWKNLFPIPSNLWYNNLEREGFFMNSQTELTHNILLHYHNVHGHCGKRQVRIHDKTMFLAGKRVVEHSHQTTQERLLRFLPLKHTETKEYLKIPDCITTEDQLLDYVERKKPSWVEHPTGRKRRNRK